MQWEYLTIIMSETHNFWHRFGVEGNQLNEFLNEKGREGFELISTTPMNDAHGATREVVFIFKRPRDLPHLDQE